MKKFLLNGFLMLAFLLPLAAQNNLLISPEDLRVEKVDGGTNIYIRKKPGLESVMLTETTKDPYGKIDNYAYRATEYNPVNGDEIRILDGKKLDSKYAKYSLVDSTPEDTDFFGPAFHIYIPKKLVYGYELMCYVAPRIHILRVEVVQIFSIERSTHIQSVEPHLVRVDCLMEEAALCVAVLNARIFVLQIVVQKIGGILVLLCAA